MNKEVWLAMVRTKTTLDYDIFGYENQADEFLAEYKKGVKIKARIPIGKSGTLDFTPKSLSLSKEIYENKELKP